MELRNCSLFADGPQLLILIFSNVITITYFTFLHYRKLPSNCWRITFHGWDSPYSGKNRNKAEILSTILTK